MTKTCKNCGTIGADNNVYCKNCGMKLDTPVSIHDQTRLKTIPQKKKDNKNLIIIGLSVIVIIAIILGVVIATSSNNEDNTQTNTSVANNVVDNTSQTSTNTANTENTLSILGGSFQTGSHLSDKTYCTLYLGEEHAGETVKISIVYSRDGNRLNTGNIVTKTVDSSGNIKIASAEGFSYYPDYAEITLYNGDGSVAYSQNVNLQATSGKQSF